MGASTYRETSTARGSMRMRNGTQDSQDTRDTTGSSGTTSPSESLALLTQTYVEDLAVRAYKPKTIAG